MSSSPTYIGVRKREGEVGYVWYLCTAMCEACCQLACDGALSDAAFAREHQNNVLDVLESLLKLIWQRHEYVDCVARRLSNVADL